MKGSTTKQTAPKKPAAPASETGMMISGSKAGTGSAQPKVTTS